MFRAAVLEVALVALVVLMFYGAYTDLDVVRGFSLLIALLRYVL